MGLMVSPAGLLVGNSSTPELLAARDRAPTIRFSTSTSTPVSWTAWTS